MTEIKERHVDQVKEFINIGMGQCAGILNQMIGSHITLKVPHIKILDSNQLPNEFKDYNSEILSSVNIPFSDGAQGIAKLVFPSKSAAKLIDMFIGNLNNESNIENMDALRMSALTEIGNIIINTVIGTLANFTGVEVAFAIPDFIEGELEDVLTLSKFESAHIILLCVANFRAEQVDITGNLILFFRMDKFDDFLQILERHYQNIIQ